MRVGSGASAGTVPRSSARLHGVGEAPSERPAVRGEPPAVVRVVVGSREEGADLVRALATRGLNARLRADGPGTRVELEASREPLDRLLVDLLPALERWRAVRGHAQLSCLVGSRPLVLDAEAGATSPDRRLQAAARRILGARPERPLA